MPETYTGDEGDDALAAGLDIMDGGEKWAGVDGGWRAINKTRDMIAGILGWFTGGLAVNKGGTGATTASGARTALGLATAYSAVAAATASNTPDTLVMRASNGAISVATPVTSSNAATKGYVDSAVADSGLADGPTSTAYARNATGAGSWYAVWMNADNQFMRNTSSTQYKDNIRPFTPGDIMQLRPVIFDRIDGPADEVGFIAEEVAECIPEAVAYYDGQIDGIYDRPLIVALVAHVQALTARVAALEGD